MSFLAPLYALAAAAILLPIVFHLVRKRPKELKPFSSLMFLDPAPPRLTSQSRIDQWLLLALRSLAIGLLAFAFSRPYWNSPAETDRSAMGARKMILIDSSASMRRSGLWERSLAKAEALIRNASPLEWIAVYQFDRELHPLTSVDAATEAIPEQRKQLASNGLRSAKVSWFETDLGNALATAADLLVSDREGADESDAVQSEIVVITDFQSGTKLDKLAEYAWPKGCQVQVELIQPEAVGNASAIVAKSSTDDLASMPSKPNSGDETNELRVRVSNQSKNPLPLQLRWLDREKKPIGEKPVELTAPSSVTSIVRVPRPANGIAIELIGDQCDFDNLIYVAKQVPQQLYVGCIDSKSESPESSLSYFLQRLPLSQPGQTVDLAMREPGSETEWPSPKTTPWIVASHHATEVDCMQLAKFANEGGHVLFVMDAESNTYPAKLSNLQAEGVSNVSEVKQKGYKMMEQIDFRHPLFADLSSAKFNDFTKVRFWKHRRVELSKESGWQVLAKLDDGDPAIAVRSLGQGKLWLMTSGWQPVESQLALSSKFVPIMASLFRLSAPSIERNDALTVGDRISLAEGDELVSFGLGANQEQSSRVVSPVQQTATYFETTEPGLLVRRSNAGSETTIAVNIPDSESQTLPGDLVKLERFGVTMNAKQSEFKRDLSQRQLRAVELESQQSWWRWLVVGVLGAVGLESILCVIRNNSK